MKKTAIWFACLGWTLIALSPLSAQKLEDFLSNYTGDNGKKYLQPLGDAFGANLNSGWYHGAKISTMGLHFYIGLETMMATIGNKQKTFTAVTEEDYYPQTEMEVPTVFGDTKNVSTQNLASGAVYVFPGGMNVKMLPLGVPQVTVGSIFGTEGSVRWAQYNFGKDIGKLSLLGFGVRHSISQYIPLLPVDLSAGAFMQSFKVGDIVDAKTLLFGVQGSYSAGILTIYGGLGMEKSSLKISYESGDGQEISFDLDANNRMRVTAGLALKLVGLNIHADYTLASQSVLALGIGVGL